MGGAQQLRDLLAPLGVYRWEGSFQWGELRAAGAALDGVAEELATLQREMCLVTAESYGLDLVQALLPYRPGTEETAARRAALAAQLRIGGNGPAAMTDALRSCGLAAEVRESSAPLQVTVVFPTLTEAPEDDAAVRAIVEAILPAHLYVRYQYGPDAG